MREYNPSMSLKENARKAFGVNFQYEVIQRILDKLEPTKVKEPKTLAQVFEEEEQKSKRTHHKKGCEKRGFIAKTGCDYCLD